MKDPVKEFKKEIDKFLKDSGMTATVFCIRAARDRTLYHRLKKGQEPGIRKVEQVRAFIKRHQPRVDMKKERENEEI